MSFFSWGAFATDWLRTYPKFRYTCMRKYQYKHDMWYMYMFWQTPHILLENKVAIQSKLSNLGIIGQILPRPSYCNHYVLCKALLSFSCFSDLRVLKFWRTQVFVSCLVKIPCLAFLTALFLALAELNSDIDEWLLTCCWPKNLKAIAPSRVQFLAWYGDVFFLNSCAISCFDFSHLICFSADRKSTRLNSSHWPISYAVFCLKKKKKQKK